MAEMDSDFSKFTSDTRNFMALSTMVYDRQCAIDLITRAIESMGDVEIDYVECFQERADPTSPMRIVIQPRKLVASSRSEPETPSPGE